MTAFPFNSKTALSAIGLSVSIFAAVLLVQSPPPSSSEKGTPNAPSTGKVRKSTVKLVSGVGQVEYKKSVAQLSSVSLRFEELPLPLELDSELTTGPASLADLESADGQVRLRLLSNARVKIAASAAREGATAIDLISGDIESLNRFPSKKATSVIVRFEGQALDLSQRYPKRTLLKAQTLDGSPEASPLNHPVSVGAASLKGSSQNSANPSILKQSGNSEVIQNKAEPSNESIRTQLKAQAGGIQKCYISMVNRLAETKSSAQGLPSGELIVSFQILPSGKVIESQLKKVPFADATFNRCVTDSLTRIRFQSFASQHPVEVESMPIRIE